jgi:predicted ArsR family transcriptional regulator
MTEYTHKLLEREEAADYLGISTTALDRHTRRGHIAYIEMPSTGKAGRPTRKWTIRDLNDFIDSRRRVAAVVSTKPVAARNHKSSQPGTARAILNGGE